MKLRASVGVLMTLMIAGLLWLPGHSHAATSYATFESFYRPSSISIWTIAGVAALFTVLASAAIVLTSGAASPIVAATGTWIGGLMGYSGAVATNTGLALLGGGSIASGGFGIIGALSFSQQHFPLGPMLSLTLPLSRQLTPTSIQNLPQIAGT